MSGEDDIEETEEAPPEPLPMRKRQFVDSYMGDANGNGTKAARMAGYAGDENVLAVQASRLLRSGPVKRAMEARLENDHLVAGRIERTRFLTRVMRGVEMEKRVVGRDNEGNPIVEPCEPTLRERLSAQEALSKLAGEQISKHELSGRNGKPIEIVDMSKLSIEELFELAKGGDQ